MSRKAGHLLLGFPRSGTTLLSRLLNAHHDVSCPPETYLMSSAARFLHEQDRVEGPPIGVLAGLIFCGLEQDEILDSLRNLVFDFHERIAVDAKIWVDKTAIDVFHLETLEELLTGHVRFIVLERHPLDVIVSNMKLAQVMGGQLDDLFNMTKHINSPEEGIARAWADRSKALRAFCARNTADVMRVSYEQLTQAPDDTLKSVFDFLALPSDPAAVIKAAFAETPPVGLGDFNFVATTEILPARKNSWRGKIAPMTLSRILEVLEPEMTLSGYEVPKAPRAMSREQAIRQFQMAATLKRQSAQRDTSEG